PPAEPPMAPAAPALTGPAVLPAQPAPSAPIAVPRPGAELPAAAAPAESVPVKGAEATPRPVPSSVSAAAPLVIAAGTTAPAFRLFARAIHAARRDEAEPLAPAALGSPTLAPAPPTGVETARSPFAPLPLDGAPLDMAGRHWPQAMVDRIEQLRDAASAAADAADTSIRLVPDALGTIDVSVRREGDTVHVRLAAEQAATRTLLAEAQPRLHELAEARGIKLAQADVGANANGGQRQPVPQPARTPIAPAGAARDDEPSTTTTRIA
ncbi:MAG TPA: flagellar hook-length control protein FliK, partial [Methylobacterium sp.]